MGKDNDSTDTVFDVAITEGKAGMHVCIIPYPELRQT
jgi:hypothetical protein